MTTWSITLARFATRCRNWKQQRNVRAADHAVPVIDLGEYTRQRALIEYDYQCGVDRTSSVVRSTLRCRQMTRRRLDVVR